MGRPLVEALDEPSASYDLSSLIAIVSTAAVFSPAVKDEFFRHFENIVVTESIGSSESGGQGYSIVPKGATAWKSGGPNVNAARDTVVLDDDLRPLEPGTGVVGRLARKGNVPLEYYKDPKKTAETFVTSPDGIRYVMPGDAATLEADGSITLLGRGSGCINSGGEKIFPEEVESAVKSHPEVYDAIVVGVPDERWGSRVAAVAQARGEARPSLEEIQRHCRDHIAGYKVPRELHWVDHVERSPSGKPDYRWAKSVAEGG
jgi:acyl-CoA synthetase (AMP-forming)/AMP-acid ligase II